jgi:GTP-binding protein Era
MKTGYVSITGKPNVGKSTFLNKLLNQKISIVSSKPQTTRNQIKAIFSDGQYNISFIDTPGYHDARNKLDLFLNSQIKSSYKTADVVLLFIDTTRPIDDEDKTIIKLLKSYEVKNIILVLTKMDTVSQTKIDKYINEIKNLTDISHSLAISSFTTYNIINLINLIKTYITNDDQTLEQTDDDKLQVGELIREQVIYNTKQELPYSVAVFVHTIDYDKQKNVTTIKADIIVEKESQKPIIIGRGGQMIKQIGTMARKEMLNLYDSKINLQLFVKLQKD